MMGQNGNTDLIQCELNIRKNALFKSVRQLSLLNSGVQRCRRMKIVLKAEEQRLQQQLEILNSKDPTDARKKETIVAYLLGT